MSELITLFCRKTSKYDTVLSPKKMILRFEWTIAYLRYEQTPHVIPLWSACNIWQGTVAECILRGIHWEHQSPQDLRQAQVPVYGIWDQTHAAAAASSARHQICHFSWHSNPGTNFTLLWLDFGSTVSFWHSLKESVSGIMYIFFIFQTEVRISCTVQYKAPIF